MGPIWGRQDPGGPHVGPTNFTIWVYIVNGNKATWGVLFYFRPLSSYINESRIRYQQINSQ